MEFSKPIVDLIRQRKSCRTYEKQKLELQTVNQINRILSRIQPGPFGTTSRFLLIASTEGDAEALKGLGTYGVIRNPAGFIVGTAGQAKRSLLDFGYHMERFVLQLEDFGLSSCWLGGSFKKSRFAQRIQCTDGEDVPAVLSIGIPAKQRSLIDRLFRAAARSEKRRTWSELFFHERFDHPLSEKDAGLYAECLELVRMGPSASNKQPWRVIRDSAAFHFYLSRAPGYSALSKRRGMADLQEVDMGIAACHFELTARESGFEGRWLDRNPNLRDVPPGIEYIVTWVDNKNNK